MRVVCMVPSWTETLIESGVQVVGRSRFCIHPAAQVKGIPAVGGTKSWNIEKVRELHPDLIILDREENTLEMAETATVDVLDTHVQSVTDLPAELRRLRKRIGLAGGELDCMAERYERVLKVRPASVESLPGVIEWIKRPQPGTIRRIVYMIWKNPWMAAGRNTFIGSMLELVLGTDLLIQAAGKYPKIDIETLDPRSTLLLFSSEPFPFAKHKAEIMALPFPSAIVDGESWSWFGIRALRFLETLSL